MFSSRRFIRRRDRARGQQGLAGQAPCFGDGLFAYITAPIVDKRFSSHASGNLFQNVGHKDAGPDKPGLAMADRRVGDDIPSERLCHRATALVCVSP
jgi:hypothetical protein